MAAIIERSLPICVAATLVTSVAFAETEFNPFITVSETYTDNVTLAPEGLEEAEWVTTVAPGFDLNSTGTRHEFQFLYQMESLFYEDVSDRNETFHAADITSELDIWRDRFGIDFLGGYGQTIADPREPIPLTNVSQTSNRLNFSSANLNPYFTFLLGTSVDLRIDHARGIVNYDRVAQGPDVDDVERVLNTLRVGSTEDIRFEWALNYSEQKAEFDFFPDFLYDRADIELGIPVGGGFSLIGLRGVETDVNVSREVGGLDSDFSEVGVRWESGTRTMIEVRKGDRFFGTTSAATVTHDGDRLSVFLNLREDPTTLGLEEIGRPVLNLRPGDTRYGAGLLTQEVFIAKSLTGEIRYELSRIETRLTVSQTDRDFLESPGETEGESQLDMEVFWRFGGRSNIGFGLFRMDIDFRGGDGATRDRLRQFDLSLNREVGSRSNLAFILRRERRSARPASSLEYLENAFIVEFRVGSPVERDS